MLRYAQQNKKNKYYFFCTKYDLDCLTGSRRFVGEALNLVNTSRLCLPGYWPARGNLGSVSFVNYLERFLSFSELLDPRVRYIQKFE